MDNIKLNNYDRAVIEVVKRWKKITQKKITKEQLATCQIKSKSGRKLPKVGNDYISQKYIDYVSARKR